MSEPLEETLRRLKAERDEADRRYNDTLTALDRALPGAPAFDSPVSPLDDTRVAELNQAWNILPAPPTAAGFRQKLVGFVWRTVGPYLQRQLAFNSILVDHINRNLAAQQAAQRREEETIATLREYAAHLTALHSQLMLYLQQITAYVDTRDREAGSGALVLNAALSGLAEAQAKYRESFTAREHRYEARAIALAAAHEDLRQMLAVAQQSLASLRRHVEQAPARAEKAQAQVAPPPPTASAFAPSLDAYKYLAFEDRFRGSQSAIRERQQSYIEYFVQSGPAHGFDVLDVGCGRGEFIELLASHGIAARGIDLNEEMVETCRARGLNVVHADAVGYLASLEDDALRGVFAAQVVEHLEPSYLLRFLDLAFQKLHPGGTLVLETLNPACWTAFFESYIRDITHRWPLHPETLQFLVTASGFTRATVEFRSPMPPADRLQHILLPVDVPEQIREVAETVNGNTDRLNARMFTFMDYAVVAEKQAADTW